MPFASACGTRRPLRQDRKKLHRTNDMCGGVFSREWLLRASLDPEPGASASIIKPYSDEYGEAQYINYGGVLSHETDN